MIRASSGRITECSNNSKMLQKQICMFLVVMTRLPAQRIKSTCRKKFFILRISHGCLFEFQLDTKHTFTFFLCTKFVLNTSKNSNLLKTETIHNNLGNRINWHFYKQICTFHELLLRHSLRCCW